MSQTTPNRIGALGLLAICFLTSFLLRLLLAGPALGQELAQALASDPVVPPTVDVAEADAEKDLLLQAIRAREAELDARAEHLEKRLKVLAEAEAAYAIQLRLLKDAEAQLAATLAVADTAADEDVKRLTAVYENMKSKDAAEIFNAMDPRFAAGFLSRMAATSAADILSNMDTERAYTVSVVMAGQNANPPPENLGDE